MDLRRKELPVITISAGRAPNAWRERQTSSFSIHNPLRAPRTPPRTAPLPLPSRVPNDTHRIRPLPALPHQAQNQTKGASTLLVPRPTILLLERTTFAEDEEEAVNANGSLRRKPHIRRHHRRTASECPLKVETVFEVPASPEELRRNEALTPLIESLVKLYADTPHTPLERPSTIDSSDLEPSLDSPSVYSVHTELASPREGEPILQPFVDGRVAAWHDWDNGVHYRDAQVYGVPEGMLLPKRVPTVQLRALLRARRIEAGLPVDVKIDPMD